MKPAPVIFLILILILTACVHNPVATGAATTGGTGSTSIVTNSNSGGTTAPTTGNLLPDPLVGLDSLTHYKADLTVAIQETTSSGAVNQNEQYSLSVWPADQAAFEVINSFDDAGQPLQMTLGKVGQAGYLLWTGDTDCQVTWGATNIKVDATNLTSFLYDLGSGTSADDETIAGTATHAYQINSDSIGIQGLQANGEIWLAATGGFLVKYHLVLTGDQALFGADGKGTETIDYALSEINDGSPVTYPEYCAPVLTDIPASADAQDVERLPNNLSYTSATTPDDLKTFYDSYFTGQGWNTSTEETLSTGEEDLYYSQDSTGLLAVVTLQAKNNVTSVEVLTAESQATQSSASTGIPTPGTPVPTLTPTSGPSPTPGPTVDVSKLGMPQGLTLYPGATGVDTSGVSSASGYQYIVFNTQDTPDQVTAYYNQELTKAGWTTSTGPANTPDPTGMEVWSWASPSFTIVSVMAKINPQGGSTVTLMWMAL